jgi:hypothetical protein
MNDKKELNIKKITSISYYAVRYNESKVQLGSSQFPIPVPIFQPGKHIQYKSSFLK